MVSVTCTRSCTWKVVESGLEPRSVWAPSWGSSHRLWSNSGGSAQWPARSFHTKSAPGKPSRDLKAPSCLSVFAGYFPEAELVRCAGQVLTHILVACEGTRLRDIKAMTTPRSPSSQHQHQNPSVGFRHRAARHQGSVFLMVKIYPPTQLLSIHSPIQLLTYPWTHQSNPPAHLPIH